MSCNKNRKKIIPRPYFYARLQPEAHWKHSYYGRSEIRIEAVVKVARNTVKLSQYVCKV